MYLLEMLRVVDHLNFTLGLKTFKHIHPYTLLICTYNLKFFQISNKYRI